MTQNLSLRVVFLHDTVVLPGIVVPIELDDQARAAIDAARLAHDSQPDAEPTRVLEETLVHELAHLLESGHDAKFWAWVDRYPQAERAKGYLLGWSAAAKVEPPPSGDAD